MLIEVEGVFHVSQDHCFGVKALYLDSLWLSSIRTCIVRIPSYCPMVLLLEHLQLTNWKQSLPEWIDQNMLAKSVSIRFLSGGNAVSNGVWTHMTYKQEDHKHHIIHTAATAQHHP